MIPDFTNEELKYLVSHSYLNPSDALDKIEQFSKGEEQIDFYCEILAGLNDALTH